MVVPDAYQQQQRIGANSRACFELDGETEGGGEKHQEMEQELQGKLWESSDSNNKEQLTQSREEVEAQTNCVSNHYNRFGPNTDSRTNDEPEGVLLSPRCALLIVRR